MEREEKMNISPSRKELGEFHINNAHTFLKNKQFDEARQSFFAGVEAWKQAAQLDATLEPYHLQAQKEYEEFSKIDPAHERLLPEIKNLITKQSGILQTEVYKKMSNYPKQYISYVLYFAEKHSEIVRVKNGRTYSLNLR